jgi:hypothetical protein
MAMPASFAPASFAHATSHQHAVELHACFTKPTSLYDGCSTSRRGGGALCDDASPARSAMTSIHPPKQQGDIVCNRPLQVYISDVSTASDECLKLFIWMWQKNI